MDPSSDADPLLARDTERAVEAPYDEFELTNMRSSDLNDKAELIDDDYLRPSVSINSTTEPDAQSSQKPSKVQRLFGKYVLRSGRYIEEKPIDLKANKAWRGTCRLVCLCIGVTLVFNASATGWASTRSNNLRLGTLYAGDCKTVENLDKGIHLVINLLSTALLGSSSYLMQCISSLTRKEVDEAHSKYTYADIGVPSVRNIATWRRRTLYGLLIISTIPLHLFWNSAIFTLTQTQEFQAFVVTPEFLNSDTPVNCSIEMYTAEGPALFKGDPLMGPNGFCSLVTTLKEQAANGTLVSLTNAECISAYRRDNVQYRNLLLVTPPEVNGTILFTFDSAAVKVLDWNCTGTSPNETCSVGHMAENQLALNDPVDHCLSQSSPLDCELQFSGLIMLLVTICNLIKFCCVGYFLLTQVEPVLMTVGDCIASFLEFPDTVTIGRPFLSGAAARKFAPSSGPEKWNPKPLRWYHAPSELRWRITLSICMMALILSFILLLIGNSFLSEPYSLGFGIYNSEAIVNVIHLKKDASGIPEEASDYNLFATSLLANLPQVLVSCIYFSYNAIFSSMLSASEWSKFSISRKALRTSTPQGKQRSTYWISLPWRWSIPLAATSSLLHFLVSQSMFPVRQNTYNWAGGLDATYTVLAVGYSPLAILLSLLFVCGMIISLITISNRKLEPCVLTANNSLAIAAVCHRPEDDINAAFKPLMWGAVKEGEPHCCFTSQEVEPAITGAYYS